MFAQIVVECGLGRLSITGSRQAHPGRARRHLHRWVAAGVAVSWCRVGTCGVRRGGASGKDGGDHPRCVRLLCRTIESWADIVLDRAWAVGRTLRPIFLPPSRMRQESRCSGCHYEASVSPLECKT